MIRLNYGMAKNTYSMRYHKQLKRTDLVKYNWKTILKMAASEFSRASSLRNDGKGKELSNCLMRAKELLGILEINPSIPKITAIKLLSLTNQMINPLEVDPNSMYKKSMLLAS